jgi:hypothetical protein
MGGCLFTLGLICYFIGIIQLLSGRRSDAAPLPASMPYPTRQAAVRSPLPPAASSMPQTVKETPMNGNAPQNLTRVQIGQRIKIRHPQQGELTLYVLGRITLQELWQQSRTPQNPWVPTGNTFFGFWLENNILLLNWLTRYYLLDEAIPTSDVEIQRDFAPFARQFAQSDQTADVYFAYPPASWHIDDIGKFRVQEIAGEGFRQGRGMTGRFIHSSGDSKRALVLEDYEGGGQDMVWIGYQIGADDIQE